MLALTGASKLRIQVTMLANIMYAGCRNLQASSLKCTADRLEVQVRSSIELYYITRALEFVVNAGSKRAVARYERYISSAGSIRLHANNYLPTLA